MSVTLASWRETWQELGVAQADEVLFHRLVMAYSEPHRHYHTLQHLRECFERFGEVRLLAQRPAEIALALWFHDAIYDVRAKDNEERSADWACEAIADAACSARVHAMVMATKHAVMPQDHDTQLLVDCDLAILGAPTARFDESDAQIRREYAHVPLPEFKERRCRILQSFLDRPSIYATAPFRERFEAQARANLQRALAHWRNA